MKKVTLATIVLVLALPASGVLAQQQKKEDMNCMSMNMKDMDMKDMDMDMDMKGMKMNCMDNSKKSTATMQSTHTAKGVVKKIDAKTGMVTLAHEPVQSMNWPAMTMDFKVKNKMLLDKFAGGKDVEFEFAKEGKAYVVKSVK